MPSEELENLSPEVFESISVKYGDVVVTITADSEGVLAGKTNEQIIKFSADLLLKTTDASSLENFLDMVTSIQETLEEDYGFKALEATTFMTAWRNRLYKKQIGLENPPIEDMKIIRAIPVEPSSDTEEQATPQPVVDEKNQVTISIPVTKQVAKKADAEEPTSFSIIEKDK